MNRIRVIGALVDGRITNKEATEKLGLCQRQIQVIRIKKANLQSKGRMSRISPTKLSECISTA